MQATIMMTKALCIVYDDNDDDRSITRIIVII